jgi:hypothetical protein
MNRYERNEKQAQHNAKATSTTEKEKPHTIHIVHALDLPCKPSTLHDVEVELVP